MKYFIDRRVKLVCVKEVNGGAWWHKDTPEAAWECALEAVRRSVKEQREDIRDAERDLKKTLALLAKTEQRSKESLK